MQKCIFAAKDCVYLGFRTGHGGVRPEDSRIQAILAITQAKTKRDVRAFLGMTGYYRRFVRDYATITEPVTKLLKKNSPEQVPQKDKAEQSFQNLTALLVSSPLMQNPDFARTFILQTDASVIGVGEVLSQGVNVNRPKAYFSRKLLPRERAYSTIGKECLALVLAVKQFKVYLLGKPFVIQTDHKALQWLQQFREKNAQLTHWSLQLQSYTFTVQHRKGRENANAVSLSRLGSTPHFVPEDEGGDVEH